MAPNPFEPFTPRIIVLFLLLLLRLLLLLTIFFLLTFWLRLQQVFCLPFLLFLSLLTLSLWLPLLLPFLMVIVLTFRLIPITPCLNILHPRILIGIRLIPVPIRRKYPLSKMAHTLQVIIPHKQSRRRIIINTISTHHIHRRSTLLTVGPPLGCLETRSGAQVPGPRDEIVPGDLGPRGRTEAAAAVGAVGWQGVPRGVLD